MADLNEPKKETVRITPPSRDPDLPAASPEKETVRINLPNRPPPAAGLPGNHSQPASSAPVRPLPPPTAVAPKPVPPPGGTPAKRPLAPPLARSPAPVRPPSSTVSSSAHKTAPFTSAADATSIAQPTGPSVNGPAAPPLPVSRGSSSLPTPGARKETARIGATSETPMKSTVKLTPIAPAPLPSNAGGVRTTAPAKVANPGSAGLFASVPTRLCWALLGISALILLIQLWIYFS